jgi:hypothetical protein
MFSLMNCVNLHHRRLSLTVTSTISEKYVIFYAPKKWVDKLQTGKGCNSQDDTKRISMSQQRRKIEALSDVHCF